MIALGIDPGTAICGYGIVKQTGSSLTALGHGAIRTNADCQTHERLLIIYNEIDSLIKKYCPDFVGVEQLFFCKNVRTAVAVSQARGVILLAAAKNNLPVGEFTPLQVKQAVVGYGKAEKKQVAYMTEKILNLKEKPVVDDAADALAVAVCALHYGKASLKNASKTGNCF